MKSKSRSHQQKGDSYFSTEHLNADLGKRSARSGAVTVVIQGSKFVLTMATTSVLARILVPEDFGLLAMVGSVLVFVAMFQDAGLSMATVQKDRINHEQVSMLFWLNTAAGTLVAGLIVALSPVIALVFGDDRLGPIAMALAIPTFLSGVCAQHGALLQRQMRFGTEQGIMIASQVVGSLVAIASALHGAGYWSLVLKVVSAAVLVVVLRWFASGWTPSLPKRGSGAREMVHFGAHLTAGNFFMTATRNVDTLLLGYFLGPIVTGLYSKAYGLLMLPVREINKPMGIVALPTLSRLQGDPERFRRFYLRGLELVCCLSMPIVAYAAVAADEVVLLVLGPSWMGTVDIFRALAPAAFMGATNVATGWLFVPMGRGKDQFLLTLIGSVVTVAGFIVGLQWGAIGVAASFSVTSVCLKVPGLMYATKGSPVSLLDIARIAVRSVVASAVASVVLLAFERRQDFENVFFENCAFFGIFISVFALTVLALPGGRGFARELSELLSKVLSGRKNRSS
ncbi:lipopolysaccharide biosynthesis protein [Pelagicoccus sp. SDUM812002]|uniref:lipopolysaccharide biosynthesis protein n=1 Tax=Pelagicoccus sp. SDUM812002 TaxID=3041266 RepID=UPI00280D975C|nr:lipopolysaccharide biosynthesis protein [Pelagicoccus sp. SDUM812002]MDQ8188470.1 lipopolysaccharide biosynthesis protein [Pelagicoccus sp. SDUM812002]